MARIDMKFYTGKMDAISSYVALFYSLEMPSYTSSTGDFGKPGVMLGIRLGGETIFTQFELGYGLIFAGERNTFNSQLLQLLGIEMGLSLGFAF